MSEKTQSERICERKAVPNQLGPLLVGRVLGLLRVRGFGIKSIQLIGALIVVVWISSGLYKVQPDEQGVVLHFGEWNSSTGPGLHYHMPWPIDTAYFPKVTQINQLQLGVVASSRDRQMLTGDENIVEADAGLLWQIRDAGLYLFSVADPENALRVAAESALREVIAHTPIQAVLSDKRQQVADETREVLQRMLDNEKSGILVLQVQLQRIDPPPTVIDAFNDVQRARADQERARNEAEAYANDILPRARGEAERIRQEAEAYREQVVNLGQGDAQNFIAIRQSYAEAKEPTVWRLYLDSMNEVLRRSGKVIISSSGKSAGDIVPYLSLSEGRGRSGVSITAEDGVK